MEKDVRFALPEACNPHDLVSALQGRYRVQQEKAVCEQYVYYDTFDWRLYNKSLILYYTGNTLVLQSLHEYTVLEYAAIASSPVFLADFPCGGLRDKVAPIIDVRALLQLFAMQARCTSMRILNDDDKTVVRLRFEEDTMAPTKGAPPFATRLWLKPVRGYDKAAKRLSKWLTEQGCTITHDSRYGQGLAAVNKSPGAYSSKIRLSLQPAQRADEATKSILRYLWRVMQCNEAGIKDDIDTEFLHDFRVAVRRTRSALGQIKDVFPVDVTARFKQDFADLTRMTNRLRDLDVYLLSKESYRAMLPAHLRPDIEPLFAHLQRQRSKAFRTLVRRLQSPTYADILRRWEAFLEQPPAEAGCAANATRPIIEVARQRIERKCHGVVKLGTRLLDDVDDRRLHALRIECKKLRYLLEFFSSLFPDQQTATLVKHLRALQDNLGRANDLSVQQESLHHFAAMFSGPDAQARKTLRAIDSLIGVLEGEKHTVRQAFPEIFTTFAAQITREV